LSTLNISERTLTTISHNDYLSLIKIRRKVELWYCSATIFLKISGNFLLMDETKEHNALEDFGKHLQQLRTDRNLSLRELAAIADVEYALIHRVEKGKVNPKLTTILTLAKALDVHPKELFKYIK